MKSLNKNILFFFVLFSSTITYAQHDHGSHGATHTTNVAQPPHGGVIKEAGKYKIEMVTELFLKKDQLRFYLFKGNFKTILNEGVTGTITIKGNEGKTTTQKLQVKGEDCFVAQLENSDSFQATVKFTIKGKVISRVFAHQGYGNNGAKKKTKDAHQGQSH